MEHPTEPVEILTRGDRGFHGYGSPLTDSYGGTLEVYESSAACAPHVWLKIDCSKWLTTCKEEPGAAFAHLSLGQAHALCARLEKWISEVPERWREPESD